MNAPSKPDPRLKLPPLIKDVSDALHTRCPWITVDEIDAILLASSGRPAREQLVAVLSWAIERGIKRAEELAAPEADGGTW